MRDGPTSSSQNCRTLERPRRLASLGRGTSRRAVPATRSEGAAVNYVSKGQSSRRIGRRVPEQIAIEGNGSSGIELVLLIRVEIDGA